MNNHGRKLAAFLLSLLTVTCGGGTPAAPTASRTYASDVVVASPDTAAPAPDITWRCFAASGTGAFGVASGCQSRGGMNAQSIRAAAVDGAPPAPSGLTFTVSGSTVTITWSSTTGGNPPSSFVIDAGSSAGRSDITSFDTGNTATTLTVRDVPAGTYFVRVRARNARGASDPSNEVVIAVDGPGPGPCAGAGPGAPTGLHSSVAFGTVTLGWTAPGGACTPTSYVLQAGSSSGSSNLANFDTGSTATTYTATNVPSGVYYVRVFAVAAGRQSSASNEVVVALGQPTPTPTPVSCVPQAIVLPATVAGSLTDSDCLAPHHGQARADVYTFSGTAGQQVTITETSSVIDSYLVLTNGAGTIVAQDDDSAGNLNARIQVTLASSGTYSIEATGFDSNDLGSYTLTVSASTPPTPVTLTISPTVLPALTVGTAASIQLSASGGTGTGRVWRETTGSQIAGLSLNSTTGVLSGTPTTGGPYSRGVSVTDSAGNTGSVTYTGSVIQPVAGALIIGPDRLQTLTVGIPYSEQLNARGGTGSGHVFTQTTGGIAGISLNRTTGAFTGTPTTAGSYSVGFTVVDSGGYTGASVYTGTVNAAPAPGNVDVQPQNIFEMGTIYKCRGGAIIQNFTISAPANVSWQVSSSNLGTSFSTRSGTGSTTVVMTVAVSATSIPGPGWYCDEGNFSHVSDSFTVLFQGLRNIFVDVGHLQTAGNLLLR